MSQRQWIVVVGVWIMFFLFIGIPSSWEKVLAILTGILVIFMAYRIKFKDGASPKNPPFVENVSEKPGDAEQKDYSNSEATPDAKQ